MAPRIWACRISKGYQPFSEMRMCRTGFLDGAQAGGSWSVWSGQFGGYQHDDPRRLRPFWSLYGPCVPTARQHSADAALCPVSARACAGVRLPGRAFQIVGDRNPLRRRMHRRKGRRPGQRRCREVSSDPRRHSPLTRLPGERGQSQIATPCFPLIQPLLHTARSNLPSSAGRPGNNSALIRLCV
jgi:hypothetical protein